MTKNWPAKSKGVFSTSYQSVGVKKGAGDRPNQTVKQGAYSPNNEKSNLVYPASNVNTEMGMRKPNVSGVSRAREVGVPKMGKK